MLADLLAGESPCYWLLGVKVPVASTSQCLPSPAKKDDALKRFTFSFIHDSRDFVNGLHVLVYSRSNSAAKHQI